MAEILAPTPEEFARLEPPTQIAIPNFNPSEVRWNTEREIPSLNVVVVGMGSIGDGVLGGLIDKGYNILAVYGPMKKKNDKDLDIIRKTAREHNIQDLTFTDFENPETIEKIRKDHKIDLIVGANFTPRVGLEQIESAGLGMIAGHFTPLPLHPGGSGIPQQMLNDEKTPNYKYRGGVTCYRIEDDGTDPKLMDSGHVVAQNFTEYDDTHTFSTAVGELTDIAITTILDGVDKVASAYGTGMLYVGQEQRNRQDAEAKIERPDGRLRLESAEMTYRRAKATSNRPGPTIQNPNGNGQIKLFDPERIPGPVMQGTEGELVDKTDGIVYNTTQGLIYFKTAQEVPADGPKGKLMPANEVAEKLGWEIGMKVLNPNEPQQVS